MDAHRSLPQPPNHWIESVHQMTSSFIFGVTHLHKTIHFFNTTVVFTQQLQPFFYLQGPFSMVSDCCNGSIPMFDPDIISYCQAFNGCYCWIKNWICQQNGAYPKHAVPVEVMKIKSVVFPVARFHANPCIYFDFIIFHQPEIKPFGIGNDSLRLV